MRFSPLALAAAVCALTVSAAGSGQGTGATDPASLAWLNRGEIALAAGQTDAAVDAFETSAALDPNNGRALTGLADAALAEQLPGKAIRFYREALSLNGRDRAALAGIGAAFAAKGASALAETTLARLKAVCGGTCPEAARVQAALDRGTVTASALAPAAEIEQAN